MADDEVFWFEEGKEKAVETIRLVDGSPILVGIYGIPNAGKSYLINKIANCFEKEGLYAARFGSAPHKNIFESIRDRPVGWTNSLLLFHCGWERFELSGGRVVGAHEDPGCLAEEYLGRGLDLSIGIYNPNFHHKTVGKYDIVISNSLSFRKSLTR